MRRRRAPLAPGALTRKPRRWHTLAPWAGPVDGTTDADVADAEGRYDEWERRSWGWENVRTGECRRDG